MKKILALLLVMILVVGAFSACAKKDDTTPADSNTDTTTNDTTAKEVTPRDVMSNVNARKAIAMAFDKTYITDEILGNGSMPVDFFVPEGLATDSNGVDFRAKYPDGWNHYDVAAAQELWAKAKEEVGFDTIDISFLTYDSDSAKKISEYIQGQLETNLPGLTLVLDQQPFENKLDLAKKGDFEFNFAGWGPDYPDPMTFLDMWVTGGGFNDAGYKNADYDSAIESCKSGELVSDVDARWAAMQDAEEVLINQDQVVIPLYQKAVKYLERPYLTGIYPHAFGADYTYDQAITTENDGIIRLTDGSDIPTMNSSIATDQVSFEALEACLEGLVRLGENDVILPGVAESWDVSEDGLTYTFHLRDNSTWSNGDKVTANDFVYSIRRLADPANGSQYNFMVPTAGILNGQAAVDGDMAPDQLGVTAIDDNTLEIKLEIPVPYFMKLMTFPVFYPINQAFAEAQGEAYGTTTDTTLYNGTYTLSQWEIGYQFAYAKNPNYWNVDNVKNEGATFRIIKDVNTGVNLYESNEIDRIGLDADNLEAYLDDPNLKTNPQTSLYYLVCNIGNDGYSTTN